MIRSVVLAVSLLLVLGAAPAGAVIFTVDTNADSGAGSLRAALTAANLTGAIDEIQFNLDAGERVITPLTPLPVMTTAVDINGTSQPGYAGVPLVGLNGATAAGTGLHCTVNFCVVRGMAVYGFATGIRMAGGFAVVKSNYIGLTTAGAGGSGNTGTGLALDGDFAGIGGTAAADRNVMSGNGGNGMTIGADANGALIYGNYIGTNPAGTAAIGNGSYGIRSFGADNQIGTNLAGGGNVISGNARGLSLESDSDLGTSLRGNIIGLNAAGTAKIPNNGSGLELYSLNNFIGGTFAGDRNLISGNNGSGVYIGEGLSGNTLEANYIGTDKTGAVALGNTTIGVVVDGGENLIGGSTAGAGNLISGNNGGIDVGGDANAILGNYIGTTADGLQDLGNAGSGARLYGSSNDLGTEVAGAGNLISGNGSGVVVNGGTGNRIRGNRIGTNKNGNAAIANDGYAIRVIGSESTYIGGHVAGQGNVMSGNGRGVAFDADAPGNFVEGNIIGLAADGQSPLGNTGNGLEISSPGNSIGGPLAGQGNVISSNQYYGIVLQAPNATGNSIVGNKIGVAMDGTTLRGNYFGILFYGASGNSVGAAGSGGGNIIAGSVNSGIYVWFGTHNDFVANSIFANGGPGIELEPQGISPNDVLDADTGSNEEQNIPVITSALVNAGQLVIDGVLETGASAFYRVDYFSSPSCDSSGFGEGRTYLGGGIVMTDANGVADIGTSVPFGGGDTVLTATATSPDGDTSEFSACTTIDAGANPGALQFSTDQFLGYEEQGFVTITVARSGGATGAVSVQYETVDDTATSPADYEHVSGTLSFGDGEVVKSFIVPLVLDGDDGGNEAINLELFNPTGGATLGTEAEAHVLLFDYALSFPGVYISDVTVFEGDAGTTNANFKVTLTPTDHVVTFSVCTTAGTAAEPADFQGGKTDLSFNPGDAPKTVSIPIAGDLDVEGTEVFFMLACGQLLPGGYAGNIGHGFILDDDGATLPPADCGNGLVQNPETCDDNDNLHAAGDFCSPDCVAFPCGIPTKVNGALPKAGDALFVLKAGVELTNCDLRVCDVNDNGMVQASDALLILKKAVGQSVVLNCPVDFG